MAVERAESAGRTPPASAYEISRQASRDLIALLAAWNNLRDTKLPELNQELKRNQLSAIDLSTGVAARP